MYWNSKLILHPVRSILFGTEFYLHFKLCYYYYVVMMGKHSYFDNQYKNIETGKKS